MVARLVRVRVLGLLVLLLVLLLLLLLVPVRGQSPALRTHREGRPDFPRRRRREAIPDVRRGLRGAGIQFA